MKKLLILLSFLIATNVSAEVYTKSKFLGIDSTTNPAFVEDTKASDMSNFTTDKWGAITERDLFSQYNILPGSLGLNKITGLFKLYTGTRSKYFYACAGDKICKGSAGAWSDVTGSGLTITSGTYWDAVIFDDYLWLANESVKLQYVGGASSSTSAGGESPTTNCRYIELHRSRLWVANSDSEPNRLYFSSLNSGQNWTTTGGYIDVASNDGDQITGLVSHGGYLYIFKRNSIYVLLGASPDEFSVRKTNSEVGSIAPRSIAKAQGGIYFLGRNNVYFFNGHSSMAISKNIEATIATWEPTYKEFAAGVFDNKNKYFLAVTEQDGTINDAIYVYDTTLKEWYKWDEEYFNYFCLAEGATDEGEIYAGSSQNDGIVWQLTGKTGIETLIHSTKTQLKTGVSFNTVYEGTDSSPIISLEGIEHTFDSYDKLLLHLNGNDGDTTTTDEAGKAITFFDDAEISTAQYKFGYSSVSFDGSQDFLSIPDHADWVLGGGTGDFTIDCWVRFNSLTDAGFVGHQQQAAKWWAFWYINSTNKLAFQQDDSGLIIDVTCDWTPVVNTWYHVAVVRKGTTAGDWLLFIDGESQTVTTGAAHNDNEAIDDFPNELRITYCDIDGVVRTLDGYMDEIRISWTARWTDDFDAPQYPCGGTLTSDNLQINASGRANLGDLYWNETLASNTFLQFTTRTGATDDTTYDTWTEPWASASSVSINTVTGNTGWSSCRANWFEPSVPITAQTRNVDYYEADNELNPDCLDFIISTTAYQHQQRKNAWVSADTTIAGGNTDLDISDYKFIGFWLKSPVTGDSVNLALGETSPNTVMEVTAHTVKANVWEKHWWNIDGYTDTDLDAIRYMRINYLGDAKKDVARHLYLDEIWAYDFYDNEEQMGSTPDDYIQYKAILGTNNRTSTPQLINEDDYVIILEYGAETTQENSMTSEYYTHWYDFESPQYNKNFYELFMEIYSNTDSTVTVNYDIDYGDKTGVWEYDFEGTNTTNRIRQPFDIGTYGKKMKLGITDSTVASKISVRQLEMRFKKQPLQPN